MLILQPPEPAVDKESLIQKDDTIFLIQYRLDHVMAPPTEKEQGIIVFAHMQFPFDNGAESVNLLTHIGAATLSKC